jgi:hypothetical protein
MPKLYRLSGREVIYFLEELGFGEFSPGLVCPFATHYE